MANEMTEQNTFPLAEAMLPAKLDAAFAVALYGLQGHQTIDTQGLAKSYGAIKGEVERLADGDMDTVRTALAKMAEQGNPKAYALPRPLLKSGNIDFSRWPFLPRLQPCGICCLPNSKLDANPKLRVDQP